MKVELYNHLVRNGLTRRAMLKGAASAGALAAMGGTIPAFADGHSDAEKTVLKNIEAYWEARNASDWDKVVAMSSSAGMLNTNSDGSFHKPMAAQTASDWERQSAGGTGVIQVHASEAHQFNDTTVYVRYYAEGVVADGNGGMKPYRTRVTGVWVKEGKNWVVKTSHFSSAAYGGTHQTVQADFED